MSEFSARLRLPGQSRIPLGVEVDVSGERITLSSGERTVARWNLEDIEVQYLSDGFHIQADEEKVVLSVTEPSRFASELGVAAHRPTDGATDQNGNERSHAGTKVEALRQHTAEIAAGLADDSVSPQEAFAEWLGMLKDLNSRHARGTMPTPLFHELNGALLDLIPVPGAAAVLP